MAELREHIPYGYIAYTGKVLSDRDVDQYNGIQDDINRWLKDGRRPPEWLLDWSFRFFLCCLDKDPPPRVAKYPPRRKCVTPAGIDY